VEEWIDIQKKKPKHYLTVLVKDETGYEWESYIYPSEKEWMNGTTPTHWKLIKAL
jgi:hypothetical protein